MKEFILLSVLTIFLSLSAQAQLVEKTFHGTSEKQNPTDAREDMYIQAVRSLTQALVVSELGQKGYAKHKSVIENKVLSSHARFIPFMKADDLKGEPGSYSMKIELKISLDDLKSVIRENNLMVTTGDLPLMIPLIKFSDRIEDKDYSWWTDQFGEPSGVLTQLEAKLEDALSDKMKTAHFYAFRPEALGYRPLVPQAFRVENPRLEDSISLANYFKAKLLLAGDVELRKVKGSEDMAELLVRWKGINTANSRSVADLNRSFRISGYKNKAELLQSVSQILDKLSEDFANQVELGWKRGTLDTSVVRLVVEGGLPLSSYTAFKKAVMDKSPAVKEVTERLLSDDKTVFEADTSGSSRGLARDLASLALDGKKFRLATVDNEQSTLIFEAVPE